MYECKTKIRVRYAETDKMGYVYYGNYATYFEVARVESMKGLGLSYRKLEESGIMLPVLEYNIKYFKPAFYDDELTVITRIEEEPKVRIRFDYTTVNENGVEINAAYTTLVFVDIKTGKPIIAPEEFIRKFKRATAV